ncbi:MAG: DUF2786 domain-containing protein [Prevotellaceae bacterium]|nr:DUF2786 domain-containing protein [Prevotellaceae bacterium]
MKEILAKIRKLQALADSAAKIGSIAEAETATLAISRLLEKYSLSIFDVSAGDAGTDIGIDFFGNIPAARIWKRVLLVTLCEFNYCRAIFNASTKRAHIVGTEANALAVIDMFNCLQSVYRYAVRQSKIRKSETQSFFLGCVAGLRVRLEKEAQTSVMHTTAIARCYDVKIADFLAQHRIRNMKVKSTKIAIRAFGDGFETGCNTPARRTVQQKLF